MIEEAKLGGEHRAKVYKFLNDESTSQYRNVANFLTEWVAQVFPSNFVDGKNKKVFNKKVLQFVKFNRFEMFTRITLLEKFNLDKVDWLKYDSNKAHTKYFKNENNFVFWKILKWMFEDIIISLLRCYFYCTEKQKEYSRIFYYRKGVWSLLMNLSI